MTTTTVKTKSLRPTAVAAAFIRMDWIEDISYPLSMMMKQIGIVAPVFIYYFIAELIPTSDAVGDDYFTFAIIGMGVSTMLQSALGGFGGSLQRAQDRGTFETLLVEPVPWVFLPFAMNLWRVILGILSGALILLVALPLGADYIPAGIPQFVVLVLLGVVASMGVGILSASMMILAKRSQPILTLYGLAASLLGGALFSVDQLPSFLQTLALFIPQTYVINSARDVLMTDPGTFAIPFGTAVLALGIFIVVVFGLGLWLFARSLQYARKMGMLSGY